MKTKKKAVIYVIVLFFLISSGLGIALLIGPRYQPASPEVEAVRETIRKAGRIIHAGGLVETQTGEGFVYTNSFEALQNMYDHGYRVCEIDIREAGDGGLVCSHGDENWLNNDATLPASASTEEFLETRVYGEFQPMTVEMLANFMQGHPDLLIVTDVRGSNEEICAKLAEDYPDLVDRFVIQIYHDREYDIISDLGFPNIIYTLYEADEEERNTMKINRFASEHELVGITIQSIVYTSWKHRLMMAHGGTPYMFHTVDDANEMTDMLRHRWVLGVYTDMLE